MIFYYSGCGNSRFVAECLAKAGNERMVFIPQAVREGDLDYSFGSGERVGFVFPIYAWQPPQLVLDFVKRLRFGNIPSYVYMVVTYGDDAGMADRLLDQELKASGLRLDAAFGVTMPNTYVNMSFMKLDSAEVVQRKQCDAKARIGEVAKAIAERRHTVDMRRGVMPRFKTHVLGKGICKWESDKRFGSTDACVGCGVCVKVCPVKNITLEDGRPRWNGNCVSCEACYHYCPQNAIQYGNATKGKGQYHFECENV